MGDHTHKQIAGTTFVNGQTMGLARFTENYPRKFARQGSRILKGDRSQLSINQPLFTMMNDHW